MGMKTTIPQLTPGDKTYITNCVGAADGRYYGSKGAYWIIDGLAFASMFAAHQYLLRIGFTNNESVQYLRVITGNLVKLRSNSAS